MKKQSLSIILLFFLFFLSQSCHDNTHAGNQKKSLDTDYIVPNAVDSIYKDGGMSNEKIPHKLSANQLNLISDCDKQIFFNLLEEQGLAISLQDISKVAMYRSNVNIAEYGYSDIYEIHLSQDLPESIKKHFFEVVNKSKSEITLFYLDDILFFEFIKMKEYFIAGIDMSRSRGYFIVYDFKATKFIPALNTLNLSECSAGLPVVMINTDCISYKNDSLTIQNIDLNNDDTLDIRLKGSLLLYCEGLEFGKSKSDGYVPKKEITIDIGFMTHFSNEHLTWTSKGIEKSLCGLLSKY